MSHHVAFLAATLAIIGAVGYETTITPSRVADRLEQWAPFYRETDEPADERRGRLDVAAHAMLATQQPGSVAPSTWLGMLAATGKHESEFARCVLEGCADCGPYDCGRGLARSYWQLRDVACPELREVESGSDAEVMVAAECAARRLRFALSRCRDVVGAMAAYVDGDCRHPRGVERAATARAFSVGL